MKELSKIEQMMKTRLDSRTRQNMQQIVSDGFDRLSGCRTNEQLATLVIHSSISPKTPSSSSLSSPYFSGLLALLVGLGTSSILSRSSSLTLDPYNDDENRGGRGAEALGLLDVPKSSSSFSATVLIPNCSEFRLPGVGVNVANPGVAGENPAGEKTGLWGLWGFT